MICQSIFDTWSTEVRRSMGSYAWLAEEQVERVKACISNDAGYMVVIVLAWCVE